MIHRRRFTLAGAAALPLLQARAARAALQQTGLAQAFGSDFLIGTTLNRDTVRLPRQPLLDLVAREFNAVTPGNVMKWGLIQPRDGDWQWDDPDRFVAYGQRHGMTLVGHTLIWHSQQPPYLFVDAQGRPLGAPQLNARMGTHIQTVVDRYKGKIAIWDVVNEAIEEGDKGFRRTPWLEILGPGYLERAFRLAHEADPKAVLLYNDYNEHDPGRIRTLVALLRDWQKRGVPIHGIGFQAHVGLDYPDLKAYETSLQAIAGLGLPIHITELDIDVLPRAWQYTGAEISTRFELQQQLNPWTDGLPANIDQQLTARYRDFFELFLKYRAHIKRVTLCGTHDGESWKNNFPVRGRTNYPLLFDRQLAPKGAYQAVMALKQGSR